MTVAVPRTQAHNIGRDTARINVLVGFGVGGGVAIDFGHIFQALITETDRLGGA